VETTVVAVAPIFAFFVAVTVPNSHQNLSSRSRILTSTITTGWNGFLFDLFPSYR
jgi:hypothetical protein